MYANPHVTIVGGGIAGLSTAWYLQQSEPGAPALDYTLYQDEARLGGKIQTYRHDGFTFEAGPDSFLTQTPAATELCRELGLEDALTPISERRIYVRKGRRLIRFPAGFRLAVPQKLWPLVTTPLFSPLGKLRMGLEPFIRARRGSGDESLADFIRRRLGSEALAMIGEPLMASIHSADPERLSMEAAFPSMLAMERKYGSLAAGFGAAVAHRSGGRPGPPFASLQRGMSQLVESIHSGLTGDVRTFCGIVAIERLGDRFLVHPSKGQPVVTDHLVLATPAPATARLLEQVAPELSALLHTIRYSATATINIAYRDADLRGLPADSVGFVTAADYAGQLRACSVSSAKFPGRAPEGYTLLRGFLGGYRNPSILDESDSDIQATVQRELSQILGVESEPVQVQIHRWRQATPQYDLGHLDRVALIERLAAAVPGLYLTGSAYRGVGLPQCIAQGRTLARDLRGRLADHANTSPLVSA